MNILRQDSGAGWHLYNADTVDVCGALPDDSVDFILSSYPFKAMYAYSNSPRDFGNCGDDSTFDEHLTHLNPSLYRIMRPGRIAVLHCMSIPTRKDRDGEIGLKDFRGDLIRASQRAGFIWHSEVCIWKNPVTQMQRTKALGLLHKQVKKDSARSRQGLADYLVVLMKRGDNPAPIAHTDDTFPVERWQRYASPVWATDDGCVDEDGFVVWRDPHKGDLEHDASGIDATDTLQYMAAREDDDERHICPLQLGVIRRAVRLWTNPGDVVLDPFNGIGSTGYIAIQEGRKYVGVELKPSYYDLAVRNLREAEPNAKGKTLSLLGEAM